LIWYSRIPDKQYDKRIVEVYWKGNMLGYIPRMANISSLQILDDGGKLDVSISQLIPEKYRVTVLGW